MPLDNPDALRAMLEDRALFWMGLAADEVVTRMQLRVLSHDKSGDLFGNISHDEPVIEGDAATCRVMSESTHSRFTNEGTGIYIGEGPIVALHSLADGSPGYLHFFSDEYGEVFTKSVKGMEGWHWWDETLDEWSDILATIA